LIPPPDDFAEVAERFGVAAEQVRRDHLVAHLLSALADCSAGDLVLIGGTGLAHTHLRRGRVSEDVDLLVEPWLPVAEWIRERIPTSLRREYPDLRWDPSPTEVRRQGSARLISATGEVVKVQLIAREGDWRRFPTELVSLEERYRDVAPTRLWVPTLPAFAVMKASAWCDRHAARDLFDLAGLAALGALGRPAQAIAADALGRPIRGHDFRCRPPADWTLQLAHQTSSLPEPVPIMADVGQAWEAAWAGGGE
jgi:predicted nucleotidyltransferase component of viral defense system